MFDGITFCKSRDFVRLKSQLAKVKLIMETGEWVSLPLLKELIGGSETGLSARIRDLKKDKFKTGNYRIEAERIGSGGSWRYRMVQLLAEQVELF